MVKVAIGGSPTGGESVTVSVNGVSSSHTFLKGELTQQVAKTLADAINKGFGHKYGAPYHASVSESSELLISSIWPKWPLLVSATTSDAAVTAIVRQ